MMRASAPSSHCSSPRAVAHDRFERASDLIAFSARVPLVGLAESHDLGARPVTSQAAGRSWGQTERTTKKAGHLSTGHRVVRAEAIVVGRIATDRHAGGR